MENANNLHACPQCRQATLETSAASLLCSDCGSRYNLIFEKGIVFILTAEREGKIR